MNFKLIGADTSNGMKIIKNIKKVEKILNLSLNVTEVLSEDKNKYNIKIIPTLLLNNEIIASGNVINEKDLYKIIKSVA